MRLLSCSTPCCEILDVRTPPIRTVSWVLPRLHAAFAAALILAALHLAGRRRARDRHLFGSAGVRVRHPGRLHPVRPDAARRRDLPSQDAAGRAHRARGGHRLQAALHRLQAGRGLQRPCAADAPRVGHPRQSVPAADGLCDPVAALREQPHPRRNARVPAGWLGRRACVARHRVRAVELPRQHRGSADRRHDGASRVQGQSPHRLSRRHRRGVERRRLRQRGRRHHHDDDVDRRHQPAVGRESLCRRDCGLPDLRHSGRAPAAPPCRRS